MKACLVKGIFTENNNEITLKFATKSDRLNFNVFQSSIKNKVVNITIKENQANKTYDQLKTVFALSAIIFETNYDRRPNNEENHQFVNELLDIYGEKRPCFLKPEETSTIPISSMTKSQVSEFIQNLINHLAENCDFNQYLEKDISTIATIKEIFEEWHNWRSSLKNDYADMHSDGTFLSLKEWKERNTVSFASGKVENLEVAHIVSRGADIEDIDEVWNLMVLTHEEHIELQHRKGWDAFLEVYPHLRGRVMRAREIARKLERIK